MTIGVNRTLCATAIRHAEQTPDVPNCSSTGGRQRDTTGFNVKFPPGGVLSHTTNSNELITGCP